MKLIAVLSALILSSLAYAQTATVKDIDASEDSSTTIEITKNKKTGAQQKWEIQEMSSTVEGDDAATAKEAKTEWKKKCKEWQTEIKEQYKDDKENKLVGRPDCGSMSCGGEAGSKVCTSEGKYKVKSLMAQ
jgi:hypothetical protein